MDAPRLPPKRLGWKVVLMADKFVTAIGVGVAAGIVAAMLRNTMGILAFLGSLIPAIGGVVATIGAAAQCILGIPLCIVGIAISAAAGVTSVILAKSGVKTLVDAAVAGALSGAVTSLVGSVLGLLLGLLLGIGQGAVIGGAAGAVIWGTMAGLGGLLGMFFIPGYIVISTILGALGGAAYGSAVLKLK